MLDMIPVGVQRECDDLIEQLNAAFGYQSTEPVSFVDSESILKSSYLDSELPEVKQLSSVRFVDLSKFTLDEAIEIINAQPRGTVTFNWDYLLNTMGKTATNFDAIFNIALKCTGNL